MSRIRQTSHCRKLFVFSPSGGAGDRVLGGGVCQLVQRLRETELIEAVLSHPMTNCENIVNQHCNLTLYRHTRRNKSLGLMNPNLSRRMLSQTPHHNRKTCTGHMI